MVLTRKRKARKEFMVLELFEGVNDGVKRRKTREWLRERAEKGMFLTLVQLSLQDTPAFKEMMRMSPDQFTQILNAILNRTSATTRSSSSAIFVANDARSLGLKNRIVISDWLAGRRWLASGYNFVKRENCWRKCLIKNKVHPTLTDRAKNFGRKSSSMSGQTVEHILLD